MTGMYGISAYQQINRTIEPGNMGTDRAGLTTAKAEQTTPIKENSASKVETKAWSPIKSGSSLIPRKTEYGNTIGNVQLSDKAAEYLNNLKSKFHNMEFITVSKDMKAQVQKNAASYGNANKMVVLIDDEKLERMATDESYRKKYEGIIAMSQSKMDTAKNSLASTGASIRNFGMSVDSKGKESFFATVEKSQDLQKKLIEKKAIEKKEQKARERKKAEKKARQDRIDKAKEKQSDKTDNDEPPSETENRTHDKAGEAYRKEYVTFEADSVDKLLARVQDYSFNQTADKVRTDTERMLGTQVDFKG